jgi:hypothetical protein
MHSRLLMSSIVTILIRPATFLDQTMLFVVFFALLTPLWSLILATLFLFIALFLRLVNSSTVMLCWAVHSDELQRLGLGCVDELVLSAGRDNDDVGSFDIL